MFWVEREEKCNCSKICHIQPVQEFRRNFGFVRKYKQSHHTLTATPNWSTERDLNGGLFEVETEIGSCVESGVSYGCSHPTSFAPLGLLREDVRPEVLGEADAEDLCIYKAVLWHNFSSMSGGGRVGTQQRTLVGKRAISTINQAYFALLETFQIAHTSVNQKNPWKTDRLFGSIIKHVPKYDDITQLERFLPTKRPRTFLQNFKLSRSLKSFVGFILGCALLLERGWHKNTCRNSYHVP
jgi:hypothetical protein